MVYVNRNGKMPHIYGVTKDISNQVIEEIYKYDGLVETKTSKTDIVESIDRVINETRKNENNTFTYIIKSSYVWYDHLNKEDLIKTLCKKFAKKNCKNNLIIEFDNEHNFEEFYRIFYDKEKIKKDSLFFAKVESTTDIHQYNTDMYFIDEYSSIYTKYACKGEVQLTEILNNDVARELNDYKNNNYEIIELKANLDSYCKIKKYQHDSNIVDYLKNFDAHKFRDTDKVIKYSTIDEIAKSNPKKRKEIFKLFEFNSNSRYKDNCGFYYQKVKKEWKKINKISDEELSIRLFEFKHMDDDSIPSNDNANRNLIARYQTEKHAPSKHTDMFLALYFGLDLNETEAFLSKDKFCLVNFRYKDVLLKFIKTNHNFCDNELKKDDYLYSYIILNSIMK